MRRSKTLLYYHFVSKTWHSEPLISPELERRLYRCIEAECQRMNWRVLALNGTENHFHLVVQAPSITAPATIAKQVKGVSSTFGRTHVADGEFFGWQDHYGGFTVSRWDLPMIIAYVQNQKQHHANGTLIPELEETDEDVEQPLYRSG